MAETIRACLLRQARELRAQLSGHLAAVTATYLEYEADRMGSDADEPCPSRRLCVNGVRHCLDNRRGGEASASTDRRSAANDAGDSASFAC